MNSNRYHVLASLATELTVVEAEVIEETHINVTKLLHRKNTLEKINKQLTQQNKQLTQQLKDKEDAKDKLKYIQNIHTSNKNLIEENILLKNEIQNSFHTEKINERNNHQMMREIRNENTRDFIDMENEIDSLRMKLSHYENIYSEI
jgi:hypothetical protein